MFLLAVITTVSNAINSGFTASGVAVEKSAMTAPMVTTDSKLALIAVAADSVRERMLKERFMIFSLACRLVCWSSRRCDGVNFMGTLFLRLRACDELRVNCVKREKQARTAAGSYPAANRDGPIHARRSPNATISAELSCRFLTA